VPGHQLLLDRRNRRLQLLNLCMRGSCKRPCRPCAQHWAHARRQFFELADIAANARRGKNAAAISPIALEAVKRIAPLFDIEGDINGLSAEERLRVRKEQRGP
jgi:Transposase IS66 family